MATIPSERGTANRSVATLSKTTELRAIDDHGYFTTLGLASAILSISPGVPGVRKENPNVYESFDPLQKWFYD